MDVYKAIKHKRAIRKFLDQPLKEEEIKIILNAARLAQSSKNMQAWSFIAIKEKTALQTLSECGQYAGHIAGAALAIAIVTPDPDLRFNIMFDAGQAASYMQLAAWELGIGSCLATIYEHDRARELLSFPEDMHIRIAISFGYPATVENRPARQTGRRAYQDVIHLEKWDPEKEKHNPFRSN